MAPKNTPWSTKRPTADDTPGVEQPTLTDDTVPGALDGDRALVSHANTLRDKIAYLDTKIENSTVLPTGTLGSHASRHQNGGGDEISVAGLSGELADPQPPKSHSHTASDVTDFDTEVSNNADVDANTTHRGAAAPHSGHAATSHTHNEVDILDLDHDDPTAVHTDQASELSGLTAEASPADTDLFLMERASDGAKRKVEAQNLPGSGGGGGTLALGGTAAETIDMIVKLATTTQSHGSATWVDIESGVLTDTFEVETEGAYDIFVRPNAYPASSWVAGYIGLIVDESGYNGHPEQLMRSTDASNKLLLATAGRPGGTIKLGTITLAAGTHKSELQWYRESGGGNINTNSGSPWHVWAVFRPAALPAAVTAPGDLDQQSEQRTADLNLSSAYQQAAPSSGSWAFNNLQAGRHKVKVKVPIYNSSGGASVQVKVVFDATASLTLGDSADGPGEDWICRADAGTSQYVIFDGELTLEAGNHTAIVYAKEVDGSNAYVSGTSSVEVPHCVVIVEPITGSGAQGLLLSQKSMASDVSGIDATTVLSDLTQTVHVGNEKIELTVRMIGDLQTAPNTLNLRYRIDGGSWVFFTKESVGSTGYALSLTASTVLTMTVGSYLFEFGADVDGSGPTGTVRSGSEAYIKQFRGGVVEVREDGVPQGNAYGAIDVHRPLRASLQNDILHLRSEGTAEGMAVETAQLASDVTITGTLTSLAAVTGLEKTISCVPGEQIMLTFSGVLKTGTDAHTAAVGFSVDGTVIDKIQDPTYEGLVGAGEHSINFWNVFSATRWFTATASSHTIRVAAGDNATAKGSLLEGFRMDVAQYQGGYVVPENVPFLQYNDADTVDVVKNPGASDRLWLELSDGKRYYFDLGTLQVDFTSSGLGGLIGTRTASKWYPIFAVDNGNQFGVVAEDVSPTTCPTGYSAFKFLGWVYNDASDDIRKFHYVGDMHITTNDGATQSPTEVLNTASPTLDSWTALTISHCAPSGGYDALLVDGFCLGASGKYAWLAVEATGHSWGATPGDNASEAGRALLFHQSLESVHNSRLIPATGGIEYYCKNRGGGNPIYSQLCLRVTGFRDKHLRGNYSQAQAKFIPDSRLPNGTWQAGAASVVFDAKSGQPSTLRATAPQSGTQRTMSLPATWAIANGVGNLGYDEAGSQGNSKWLYGYLVDDGSGNWTIKFSDNPPSVGPAGHTDFIPIYETYIDGSGNLLHVFQNGPNFRHEERKAPSASSGYGTTFQAQADLSISDLVPATAEEAQMALEIQRGSSGLGEVVYQRLYVDGESNPFVEIRQPGQAGYTTEISCSIPLATVQTVEYESARSGGTADLSAQKVFVTGWTSGAIKD